MINETLVKYLAGLLDADGCMSFNFRDTGYKERETGNYTVALTMSLAASDTIDRYGFVAGLPEITGMGTVTKHGNMYWWRVRKRADLEMLLPRLIKHMVIKAKHWQWLLDTWRSYRGGYGECFVTKNQKAKLLEASKKSRLNVGPLKHKNHPTWAWLAGYMDGDGTYHFRKRVVKKADKPARESFTIYMSACAHNDDVHVLEFLQKALGGKICNQTPDGRLKLWQRALGSRNSSFTLNALPKLARYSKLKRHKIDAIINHSRQQRLSVPGTKV